MKEVVLYALFTILEIARQGKHALFEINTSADLS